MKWFGSSVDIDDRKRADDALRKRYEEINALRDQLYKENLALKQEIDQASMFRGDRRVVGEVAAGVGAGCPSKSFGNSSTECRAL